MWELGAAAIYLGGVGLGLLWMIFRVIRYVRRVRAQNAAEALWLQTFTIPDVNTHPGAREDPGRPTPHANQTQSPNPQAGLPQ